MQNNVINMLNKYIDISLIKSMSSRRLYEAVWRRINNLPNLLLWNINYGFSKKNKTKLRLYKDIHKGQRCFIIANGPSLNKIDFNLLKNEITIGMNRSYLLEKTKGFMPTYLACIDDTCQLAQFYEEYNEISIPCFYAWNQRHLFDKKDNQMFVRVRFKMGFSEDIVDDLTYNGGTVTYTCIQLAYYMGFSEVYLVGKDHSYKVPEKKDGIIISDGKESNHFIGEYYKTGQKWYAPNYTIEEKAYKLARKMFEMENKVIKDATIDGKLNIFEKTDFTRLFNK